MLEKCKPYYVAPVKLIMSSKCESSAENRLIGCIMGFIIRAARWLSEPGIGGPDAHTEPFRYQGHPPARIRHPEPPSRTGSRCAVPEPSLLRSTRPGAGQIRNAAPGNCGWPTGGDGRSHLRLLAGEVVSTTPTFRRPGVGRGSSPQSKGPRQASKLSDEILTFILQTMRAEPELRTGEMPVRVEQQFGVSVQLRSIERAWPGVEKKPDLC